MNQKILKYRFIIEVIISMLLIFTYIYEISDRHFLCFSNGKCVTTWENSGGLIIIPYKYYGLTIPQKFVRASYGNTGAGAYITTIKSSKDKRYSFVVDSDKLENHTHGIICTSPHGHIDLTSDEVFMINTGVEVVGHGTIIERWKGTKKETVVEPFFFFQNAYIPIYIVFCTVFFFRYITKASVVTNSAQPIKSIVIWSLKIVAETVIVIITIIGTIILLFLIMQYLFTG
jgi:hypothetical protein